MCWDRTMQSYRAKMVDCALRFRYRPFEKSNLAPKESLRNVYKPATFSMHGGFVESRHLRFLQGLKCTLGCYYDRTRLQTIRIWVLPQDLCRAIDDLKRKLGLKGKLKYGKRD